MDNISKQLFTTDIISDIKKRFDINSLISLDGFENEVFECTLNKADSDTKFILRVGHSIHREYGEVVQEIHYLLYLAESGLSVAEPVRNAQGNWLEKIDVEKGHFTAVLFKKAAGGVPEGHEWNETLYTNMGDLTGRVHKASMRYKSGIPQQQEKLKAQASGYRKSWQNELPRFIESYLDPEDEDIKKRFYELHNNILQHPRTNKNYGMIHYDFHGGNFFTDYETGQQRITLFDFDDCQEYWYIGDPAISLFYAMYPNCGEEIDPAFGKIFYQNLMRGYTRHMAVTNSDYAIIPKILAMREIDLYASIKRSFPQAPHNPDDPVDVIAFMQNRKTKILEQIPVITLDWKDY